jgi:V/A-type H+-transporting ATPase subunit F
MQKSEKKIAVIGDKDSVLAFKAIGLDVFAVSTDEEAKDAIKNVKGYGIVFITEDIAERIDDVIERYKAQTLPAIIPIPSGSGSTGYGISKVKKDVERAIGSDIVFK